MNLSLYLLTVLIWGTTWIALKFQLGEVAIPLSIAYRFALAALVLFVWIASNVVGGDDDPSTPVTPVTLPATIDTLPVDSVPVTTEG